MSGYTLAVDQLVPETCTCEIISIQVQTHISVWLALCQVPAYAAQANASQSAIGALPEHLNHSRTSPRALLPFASEYKLLCLRLLKRMSCQHYLL